MRDDEVECHAKEPPEASKEGLIIASNDLVLMVENGLFAWFEGVVEKPVGEGDAELV